MRHIAMRMRRISTLDCYEVAFGLLLFVSPWLFAYVSEKARIDIWLSGAAIALTAVAAIVAFADWEEWINLLLGVWLMISPWLLGFMHTRAMHVSLLLGAMVVFIAALELWLVHYDASYNSDAPKQATGSSG